MNIWLIVWCLLAVSLLIFMVWTFSILMRQKKAWKIYAEKRKLRYKAGSLMDSPQIEGVIGEHTISFFASEHVSSNARGSRKLTAIEVNLNSVMPIVGGIASSGMIPILKLLQLKQEYIPKYKDWKQSYVASTNHRGVLASYLTDERVAALCQLMEDENNWVILIFKDDAMLLRVDMADPLHDPRHLDRFVKNMLSAAQILELKKGEGKRLKADMVKSSAKSIELDINEDILDTPVAFELEEDHVPEVILEEIAVEAGDADQSDVKNAEGDKPPASTKSVKKKTKK